VTLSSNKRRLGAAPSSDAPPDARATLRLVGNLAPRPRRAAVVALASLGLLAPVGDLAGAPAQGSTSSSASAATSTSTSIAAATGSSSPAPLASASPSASPAVGASASSAAPGAKPRVEIGAGAGGNPREGLDPYPSVGRYLSYSVSLASDVLLNGGVVCSKAVERCVIGGGGGIALGGSYREPSSSLGAVYEVTFHDSHSIYQRGVLQQLRGEWHYRPKVGLLENVTPVIGAGLGFAVYGDNWAVATFGPIGAVLAGVEIELGVKLSLDISLSYRPLYFRRWTDASGQDRTAGIVHFLGIVWGLELNEPL
jgi:hypothetical protein